MTDFSKPNKRPFIIGIAGGSGSGKTYFAHALQKEMGDSSCSLVLQDNFYFDQSKRFDYDGGSVNFDHPNSIDFSLLASCLRQLKEGKDTPIPLYDFVTHTRRTETCLVKARPIILVDGILIFHSPELRALFDDKVFFDTHEELRFQRRMERDIKERGRKPEGVQKQFFQQVKPMHDQYVEPSKNFAQLVVKDNENFALILKDYCGKLRQKL